MDTLRNTLDSMAAGFGEQLYNGWIYPHSIGRCADRACVPVDIGQTHVDVEEGPDNEQGVGAECAIQGRELRNST